MSFHNTALKYRIRGLGILLFILFPLSGFTQVKRDSLFLQYLIDKDQQRDIITLLSEFQKKYQDSTQHLLELPYWKGMAYYSLRNLDSSAHYFSKVHPNSTNYNKSLFWAGISYSYLQQTQEAYTTILSVNTNDSIGIATKIFELAGIALLRRNFKDYDSLSHHFSTQYYPLQKQQNNFNDYQEMIRQQQRKSPFKAALLSAILPGSGKIYVGKQLGQGISTFIQNAILGLQAYEGYRKDGPASPRFIIFGSLFTLFYIGNIWGSAVSVGVKRQEFNDKINEQILFDMHIPLRTIFN
jgi:hypothetical protein